MADSRLDLSAKFLPPEPAGLFRGRLLDLAGRIGLVLAPAGAGKTTLLGQLVSQFDGPVAWYRMDDADRDPAELAGRIGRSLLRLWAGSGDAGSGAGGSAGAGSDRAGSEAGSGRPRSDGARSDGARSDGARSDGAGSDGVGSDGARSDGARSDGARSDGARSNGVGSNGAGSEAGSAGTDSAGAGIPAAAPFGSFDAVVRLLESRPPARDVLLVLDDFHEIADSESERGLVRLISMAPARLRVLLAGRRVPGLDVDALRVYGGVQVLDADDLRFRSWEVERLFRDVYGAPLLPEDAATLTRRTEGWAAGLAMFHLLTAGRPPAERRRAVADLSRGSRMVRSYLVREVLGDLPGELRDFLRRTSALGVLTGELCDQLLETTGSQQMLEELTQRHLFTSSHDDGLRFGYHQVLQDHLELELTSQLGPTATREWYARAGSLLLAASEVRAAFRAYARAEDWAAVERLLLARGAEVVAAPLGPVEGLLPVALRSQDPWLLLASARRLAARGALPAAVAAFRQARALAQDVTLADRCLEEARSVALWLPDGDPVTRGWAGCIRAATQRNPRQAQVAALDLAGAEGRLAAGIVALLAGDVDAAAVLLQQAAAHPDAGLREVALAACGGVLLDLLVGRSAGGAGTDLEALMLDAEVGGWPWLARLGRALLDPSAGSTSELTAQAVADQDRWGEALIALIGGLARRFPAPLAHAATTFADLGAPVSAQWAGCLAAAAAAPVTGVDWSGESGQRARWLGLRDALPVITEWARRGRGRSSETVEPPDPMAGWEADAAAGNPAANGSGSATDPVRAAPASVRKLPAEPPVPVQLRLFGRLQLAIGGQNVDIGSVRPRAQSTLRLLALRAPDPVHREALAGQLWPDAGEESALRSLQVAISSLRSLLDPYQAAAAGRQSSLLVRQGESYVLALPTGSRCDLRDFEANLGEARSARLAADPRAERAALRAALTLYRGDLLPEEGAAEWVIGERDRLRLDAAGAALALASRLGQDGELDEAIDAARVCLRLDPHHDAGWRLLVELHGRAGNPAAAHAAQREHEQVLAELGLSARV